MLLVATVVGSGIMAERLAGGNDAVALLGNTLATGAILYVLITALGPISGAHFNPAVSAVFALRREIAPATALAYAAAQIAGGVAGTLLAHAMFAEPLIQFSTHARTGGGAMAVRSRRHLRARLHHPHDAPRPPRSRPDRGRAGDHRRLLVHRLDLVRQPRRDHRPLADRQLLGDRAARRPPFIAAQFAGALIGWLAAAGWPKSQSLRLKAAQRPAASYRIGAVLVRLATMAQSPETESSGRYAAPADRGLRAVIILLSAGSALLPLVGGGASAAVVGGLLFVAGLVEAYAGTLHRQAKGLSTLAGLVTTVAGLLFVFNPVGHFGPTAVVVMGWLVARSVILFLAGATRPDRSGCGPCCPRRWTWRWPSCC